MHTLAALSNKLANSGCTIKHISYKAQDWNYMQENETKEPEEKRSNFCIGPTDRLTDWHGDVDGVHVSDRWEKMGVTRTSWIVQETNPKIFNGVGLSWGWTGRSGVCCCGSAALRRVPDTSRLPMSCVKEFDGATWWWIRDVRWWPSRMDRCECSSSWLYPISFLRGQTFAGIPALVTVCNAPPKNVTLRDAFAHC